MHPRRVISVILVVVIACVGGSPLSASATRSPEPTLHIGYYLADAFSPSTSVSVSVNYYLEDGTYIGSSGTDDTPSDVYDEAVAYLWAEVAAYIGYTYGAEYIAYFMSMWLNANPGVYMAVAGSAASPLAAALLFGVGGLL